MGREIKSSMERPNYRKIIFIIFVGLCALFVAETIRITVLIIDHLVYHAPLPSQLSSDTIWEVDYVSIAGQQYSPDALFVNDMIPPQIKFGSLHDYKGYDGCNGFHGLFLDHGEGQITLDPAEEDRVACWIEGHGHLLKKDFLYMLEQTTRYELAPNQLRLDMPDSIDFIVLHPAGEPSKIFDADDHYFVPLPRWECQGIPYLILFRTLGDRCYAF